ncbi:MAG: hypothetical protein DMG41_37130 [Acidobacteria bacterium]|nr:MAG: hypothetical protein AUH13_15280 [Acidobacteria bacterium 13_2_20CM_58_27]PYT80385.1 MAG: hypothetical protein DMG41_37130 [Acidobacteriota bacterium]
MRSWVLSLKALAVSLKAAVEALLKCMPQSKPDARTPELFEKAGVITKRTGQKALAAMLQAGAIERIGTGLAGRPYRYWRKGR